MARVQSRVARKGRVYRFKIDEQDYATFIWQVGKQFYGRVESDSRSPQLKGSTELAVRNALHAWLMAAKAK